MFVYDVAAGWCLGTGQTREAATKSSIEMLLQAEVLK